MLTFCFRASNRTTNPLLWHFVLCFIAISLAFLRLLNLLPYFLHQKFGHQTIEFVVGKNVLNFSVLVCFLRRNIDMSECNEVKVLLVHSCASFLHTLKNSRAMNVCVTTRCAFFFAVIHITIICGSR